MGLLFTLGTLAFPGLLCSGIIADFAFLVRNSFSQNIHFLYLCFCIWRPVTQILMGFGAVKAARSPSICLFD